MKRIIYYKQYGLGIGFSTDHARIGLIVNIVSAIDNNFFFFAKKKKKSFDTFDHNILPEKISEV